MTKYSVKLFELDFSLHIPSHESNMLFTDTDFSLEKQVQYLVKKKCIAFKTVGCG